ncbi:MAG: hypothetical protein KHX31_01875 [Akkermansia sp.]|uniref:hypothetical protein n=1 Tax=Akkermansia sp. TaxID=1872421 RepID=UPI0025BDF0C5|nr:hypothetical protein [Akkermansia sp.]MBS5507361.1 hypothetical protein [Akkermansia sp.]
MNRQSIIVARFLLCAAAALGMAAWGGGKTEEKNPVKAVFVSVGMEKNSMWINGVPRESPLQLKFGVNFSVQAPLGFGTQYNDGIQYLEATDSTGRKLAPAEFKMGGMYPRSEGGMVQATVNGVAGELPSPDASWVRLKGVFRVPVSRSMESPVYELPLAEEAEEHVPLPGANDREEAVGGDIVLSESAPTGRLFLKECSTFERNGKKMRKMILGLWVESSFDLDRFEILNEKDEVLETESRGGGSSMSSSYREWTKRLQFEEPENMQKLRFRMIYKVPVEPVSVPVDVKLGMRGEIREKKK